MENTAITAIKISAFRCFLTEQDKSPATIKKYIREVERFADFLQGNPVEKMQLLKYRDLLKENHKAQTVNGKLTAIHAYLDFAQLSVHKIKLLKVQRRPFLEESRELTEKEYYRLLSAAKKCSNKRLYLLLMTMCSTGIRVSELSYITVEAVKNGKAEVDLKGKNRFVVIPKELQKKLLQYTKEQEIEAGYIFRTRSGKPLDRSNICHDMKRLCESADVQPEKVFPHNLRHLFARSFYAVEKNLAHLADILGHSSIETTRIYVAASVKEHERLMQKMKLII